VRPTSLPARFVPDAIPDAGPLGGLFTGLTAARHGTVVCVGCDQPFLSAKLLRYLATLLGAHDAVVPRIAEDSQPLHAVYRREVAPAARRQIATADYRLRRFVESLDVRWVDAEELDELDPDHRSFLNVNTPRQWEEARSRFAG